MIVYVVRLGRVDYNKGRFYGAFSTQEKAQEWLSKSSEGFQYQCVIEPHELDSLLTEQS